ncbi:MAG: hypothetical protein KR126chlam5_00589 [Candidatus Anoxychlamydiales bacterium]|nr:hypothetical protein [Candidatus Anoxychlamydiales bacterium]NGX52292.1 hypothetical protein [Candidatus Anoxychlamydiales bacterium]
MTSSLSSAKNYISSSFSYLGKKIYNQDKTNGILDRYKRHDNATNRLEEHVKTCSKESINKLCEASKVNYASISTYLKTRKLSLLVSSSGKDLALLALSCIFSIHFANPSLGSFIGSASAICFFGQQSLRNLDKKGEILKLSLAKMQQKALLARQKTLRCNIIIEKNHRKIENLTKCIIINHNIKKHKIAKITSISCFALGLVAATIGSIMITASLLGVGFIAVITTRYFSKKIESDYQEISKKQKESKLNSNYQLYSNKLFYMKIQDDNKTTKQST